MKYEKIALIIWFQLYGSTVTDHLLHIEIDKFSTPYIIIRVTSSKLSPLKWHSWQKSNTIGGFNQYSWKLITHIIYLINLPDHLRSSSVFWRGSLSVLIFYVVLFCTINNCLSVGLFLLKPLCCQFLFEFECLSGIFCFAFTPELNSVLEIHIFAFRSGPIVICYFKDGDRHLSYLNGVTNIQFKNVQLCIFSISLWISPLFFFIIENGIDIIPLSLVAIRRITFALFEVRVRSINSR